MRIKRVAFPEYQNRLERRPEIISGNDRFYLVTGDFLTSIQLLTRSLLMNLFIHLIDTIIIK